MAKLKFKIATPERVIYESEVDQVTCPTQMGQITILPHHTALVANLVPGELKILQEGKDTYLAVAGGFIEVRESGEVVALADAAEHEEEIDIARAEAARDRARQMMKEKIRSEEEYALAAAALERSLARLRIARRRHAPHAGPHIRAENTEQE